MAGNAQKASASEKKEYSKKKNPPDKKPDPRKQILFKQIGAKIAYYRTLREMTQADLAKRAGISQSTLSKIERGKYNDSVPVSLLMDIADGLQIDMALLVTFNETERNMWWSSITSS